MQNTLLPLLNGQDIVLLTVLGRTFISTHDEGASIRVGHLSSATLDGSPIAHVQLMEADGDQDVQVNEDFDGTIEAYCFRQAVTVHHSLDTETLTVAQTQDNPLLIFKEVTGDLPRMRVRTPKTA